MPRQTISPGRLFALMTAAFTARRSPQCTRCRLPLPMLIVRPDEVSANWKVGTPPPCAHGCDRIIAEISAALWPVYDLFDPSAVPLTDDSGLTRR